MKIVVLGDIHGDSIWKEIIEKESDFDKLVFLGDYLDSHDFSRDQQISTFNEIINFKITTNKEVILLIGNHDYHYFPEVTTTSTSGYNGVFKYRVVDTIDKHRDLFKICHKIDKFLFTHAGVSPEFMDEHFLQDWDINNIDEKLNDLFKHKPHAFDFNGFDPYGDDTFQTPIWIRPRSLMKSNKDKIIYQNLIQIVGHTKVNEIDIKGKATGGKYFFIDSLPHKEYLIINDGIISKGKL